MTGRTTIEWTDQPGYRGAVWNPTTGCTRVSAGCDNCYAFALHDKRYATNLKVARERISDGLRVSVPRARDLGITLPWPRQYDLPFSRVQLLEDRLDAPLRTRTPTCYFVDSMSDLFHEDVPVEFIGRVFNVMGTAERHRFLILTKRPERMTAIVRAYYEAVSIGRPSREPYPNVWLGTSIENQRSADERIPHLLATPAAVRFLSCEPLLGPITLPFKECCSEHRVLQRIPGLHWVIVGGESGPRARLMDLAWARSLVAQCRAAGVAPFVKQLGAEAFEVEHLGEGDHGEHEHETYGVLMREPHGRDMAEWPEDLRVREFPAQRVPA